ncbi:UDP-N-acetylglucosamine 2-epimerase [Vibrio natriegens]|uniref:UDP-N-acetylglucosamine 2-epimerase n=1 Tax=Vibrio natriegens TaxID=691 RepID=UPI003F87A2CE
MIHILIGTRAQLIKMIPLMREMQDRGIDYNFIFMAQHRITIYEMLQDFDLKAPDFVLCDEGSDIVSTGKMVHWSLKVLWRGFWSKKNIFRGDKNGIVLIHGDAPPLFLGAVLAKLQGLKVGSVEAGLRSFNMMTPFPEELTRVFTARLGLINVFFCQDDTSLRNAQAYGKGRCVHTQGNTIIDAIRLAKHLNQQMPSGELNDAEPFVVVTLHRFETISNKEGLNRIVELVNRITREFRVKFILHPPTRAALQKSGHYHQLKQNKQLDLLPRMRFIDFNALISKAAFLVSDGGSNQEETAYLGIPCLLFRDETERQDGLGENVVLSHFDTHIIDAFIANPEEYRRPMREQKCRPIDVIIDDVMPFV